LNITSHFSMPRAGSFSRNSRK